MTTIADTRRRRGRVVARNTAVGWSFLLPNFAGFVILTMVPVALLFYYAFTEWDVFGGATWTGLENFRQLARDASFWTALRNTLYYAAFHIPLTLGVSLGLALLLNRRLRGVAFFRTVAFFPYITSIVAIAQIWNMLFSPGFGPVNEVLRWIGVDDPPGWTTSADASMPAVIVVGTWRYMGYYMLLFLAGLQTIPAQLYEAALVDGAGAWQRFRAVTLPGLRHTTFFITVLLTIESFKVLDLILVMTDGGPGQSTLVLSQYIFQKGFEENQFGYASAVSVVLFAICFVVTVVQFVVNKRRSA
ncbi:multiple sugar transport system permease protein/alpha-1,4-digalacturonate transport system permease protein [Actinoplanes campanulatus]|uniref:Multiple sugar transport system permease protein/alpha-1,4-digalacturonate transport system permease protein n=1 Tax=Actinoplanes campanulatus TaxID=113559 RepID=A0A7W5ARW1_9ACTN|nr:sugar ABC transporter permease [Actinoplanes campanulatus]MBB3101180.1 multiple sugar transport system permease protein/alpha-1,4-digalacturonate transport system permease protein [Actinoplanes campanulatus]GGN49856.1 ABC transporter permease [Actinoplanes campanulatus]GID41927.1 ABC transporter permease [Actinoplanes campanulatus]